MKTVQHYELEAIDPIIISLPMNADVLTVQVQKGVVSLFALIDPKETRYEVRAFKAVTTSHQFEVKLLNYVGTFQTGEGQFMFHLFEIERPEMSPTIEFPEE